MKVQVRNRLQRWRYTSIGAFPRIIFFVLFGLTLLLPQTFVEAAGADIKAIDGQRQFDVIVFKLKNIEEKNPALKGVCARVRSDLSDFETSTDPSVERMRTGVADLRARKLPPEKLLAEVNRIVNERVTYVISPKGAGKLVSKNPGQTAEPATGSLLEKIKSHEEQFVFQLRRNALRGPKFLTR